MKDKEKIEIALNLFRINDRSKWRGICEDLFETKKIHIGPENEPMTQGLYRKIKFALMIRYGKIW